MNFFNRIVMRLLGDYGKRLEETERRLDALEAWQKQVEAVWPEVINDGTD